MESLIERPSSNYNDRKDGSKPSYIIIHATQMKKAEEALDLLCNEEAKVSAHYLIKKSGVVYRLVADEQRAWHAGESFWKGEKDVNSQSIGIEIDNAWEPYTSEQLFSLVGLLKYLCDKHNIAPENIWGHSDVAPHRKEDPGEHFPWKWLGTMGFGLCQKNQKSLSQGISEQEAKEILGIIGYNTLGKQPYSFSDVLLAFQRHFLPGNCTSKLDKATQLALFNFKKQSDKVEQG